MILLWLSENQNSDPRTLTELTLGLPHWDWIYFSYLKADNSQPSSEVTSKKSFEVKL